MIMTIEERINADVKASMLAKDAKRLEAVRALKSAILLLKTSAEGLSEDSALKAISREYKKRKETAVVYTQQNRQDLADVELSQAAVIEEYLPKQLSEAEVVSLVEAVIAEIGATSIAEMGKVMGVVTKRSSGQADGQLVSKIVKEKLAVKA